MAKLVGDARRFALLEYYGLKRQVDRQLHEMAHLREKFRGRPRNLDEALDQGQAKKRFFAVQSEYQAAAAQARRIADSIGIDTKTVTF